MDTELHARTLYEQIIEGVTKWRDDEEKKNERLKAQNKDPVAPATDTEVIKTPQCTCGWKTDCNAMNFSDHRLMLARCLSSLAFFRRPSLLVSPPKLMKILTKAATSEVAWISFRPADGRGLRCRHRRRLGQIPKHFGILIS